MFMRIKNTHNNSNRGFTLVETLVAILIFASSVVALLTATSGGLTEVTLLRNKLSANYLAQQGIEFVRNARDRSIQVYGTNGWNQFLAGVGACQNASGCGFNPFPTTSPTVVSCTTPPGDPCSLSYSELSGLYIPSSPSNILSGTIIPTTFRRVVTVQPTIGLDEAKITSTVTWTQGVSSQHVVLEEYIYNW